MARQGFGGSSGLREVRKNAQWNQANIGEVTAGMIEIEDMPVVDTLVGWLDMHPATACWADYHAKARAALTAIHDDYTGIRDSLADGNGAPVKLVTDAVSTADDLSELPTPADCP